VCRKRLRKTASKIFERGFQLYLQQKIRYILLEYLLTRLQGQRSEEKIKDVTAALYNNGRASAAKMAQIDNL